MRYLSEAVRSAVATNGSSGLGQFNVGNVFGRRGGGSRGISTSNSSSVGIPRQPRMLKAPGTIGTTCPYTHPQSREEGCCSPPDASGNIRCISKQRTKTDSFESGEVQLFGVGQILQMQATGDPVGPDEVGVSCSSDKLCSQCCGRFRREAYADCIESCSRPRQIHQAPIQTRTRVVPAIIMPSFANMGRQSRNFFSTGFGSDGLGAQWVGAKTATNGQPCSMPRVARGPNGQKVCKCWFTNAGEMECPGCCSEMAMR